MNSNEDVGLDAGAGADGYVDVDVRWHEILWGQKISKAITAA